jgi:hypothetical protein
VTFQWTAGTATRCGLWVGSTGVGSANLATPPATANTSVVVAGLPTDGRTLNVRLWSLVSGVWQFNDYTYTAASSATAADSPFQVKYASNLAVGDSVINITNTGANGGVGLGAGSSASVPGAFCANVYVYDPREVIVSCCSCPVTPNGLVSLSARNDLINNTLTRSVPTSIVIKLVATVPLGGTCDGSALLAGTPAFAEGMAAWGTSLHADPSAAATYSVTETAFTPATLSAEELARLAYGCGAIANVGSGYGVCNSCRVGGLGAAKQ